MAGANRRPYDQALPVTSLVLCLLLCEVSEVRTSAIDFTSSPSTIKHLVTESLTLRCALRDGISPISSAIIGRRDVTADLISRDTDVRTRDLPAGSDIAFVNSIVIRKGQVDIASVTEHVTATVYDNTSGVHVTGQVPVNGGGAERGFLSVTWEYPVPGLSGSYTCVVHGYDQTGHVHSFTDDVQVDESEVSLSDLVTYIHQIRLDSDQQTKLIGQLNKTIDDQALLIVSQMREELNKTTDALNKKNAAMEQHISALQATAADLKLRLDTQVFFTVTLQGSPLTVASRNLLVFDHVLTDVGGGYNSSSGIFTSPVAGYFSFEFHVMTQLGKIAEFNLVLNKYRLCAVRAESGFGYQCGSCGATVKVMKGDEVKVIAYQQSYPFAGDYSSFSGHLIALE